MQFLGEKPHSSIQKPVLETLSGSLDYFDGNLVRVGHRAIAKKIVSSLQMVPLSEMTPCFNQG